MNKVMLTGRLTRDPECRTGAEGTITVARYTLAVDRRFKTGDVTADFISCVTFSKSAEFANKYFRQGMKVNIVGRIQTGSYTNRDGKKVYTTDVIVEEQEFGESKSASNNSVNQANNNNQNSSAPAPAPASAAQAPNDGFMNIPDDVDEELPF